MVADGSSVNGVWIKNKDRYLCSSTKLKKAFKERFISKLSKYIDQAPELYWDGKQIDYQGYKTLLKVFVKISKIRWSVRIENPQIGTEKIVEYLSRYIYRSAISDGRIEKISDKGVIINYKKYSEQEAGKPAPVGSMTFEGAAFLKAFTQHFLPRYQQRTRYYGIYAGCNRQLREDLYQQIKNCPKTSYIKPSAKDLIKKYLGIDVDICPKCGAKGQFSVYLVDSEGICELTRSP